MIFNKLYGLFTFGMASYGFSRGYRANNNIEYRYPDKKIYLTSEKCVNGIMNSIFYAIPILNMGPLFRLINRLEIDYYKLDKENYIKNYQELAGICICKDTI